MSCWLLLAFTTPLFANERLPLSEEQVNALGIVLAQPESATNAPLVTVTGRVALPPGRDYLVNAPQAGFVQQLRVSVGERVTRGQVIASLTSPDWVSLQRQWLSAEGERLLAWRQYQRDQHLHQAGVIPDRRWQETEALYQSRLAQAEEAKQLLKLGGLSEHALQQLVATRQIQTTLTVHAPLDGVVLERLANTGQALSMLEPIYRIGDPRELWLELAIPPQYREWAKPGTLVQLDPEAAQARILRLGRGIDSKTQGIPAQARVESGTDQLLIGQMINAQLLRHAATPMWRLPLTALSAHAGDHHVFVRTEDGFLVKHVILLSQQDGVALISGESLHAEDRVAVKGTVALKAQWLGLGGDE